MEQFYAHSTERADKSDWQTLKDHLIAVGELAASKASVFGGEEMARVAGLLHDLGKYTDEFQRRIRGEGVRVDHATWGAKIASEKYGPVGQLMAYGIAGHHAGLANGRDNGKRTSLNNRMKNDLPNLLDHWRTEILLPDIINPPVCFKTRPDNMHFQLAFYARMLFSCLVDGDFLDTENFYRLTEKTKPERIVDYPSLKALRKRLDAHFRSFQSKSKVDSIRGEVLNHVRSRAQEDTGLFSLNVPTGGGKTLTSLAFALDHAIHHGLRRIIYVIPFTSIVEQNAAVFRQALGDLGDEAVLEHHSAFIDNPEESREAKDKLRLAMENWEPPIIVTTAVQFFESLFASRPSRCRKLHNVAGSVVILDEAQTLPLKLLRPCMAAMDELALNYQSSLVLCTATQPALRVEDEFKRGLKNVRELAPFPQRLQDDLQRVKISYIGSQTDEQLAVEMAGCEQVLCIVNNRRHARALFESISRLPGARHLTTLMCAKHRSEELAQIRDMLNADEPCRLVSTSLIEAGVDIDFPRVLRAEAGLDSVAQAAGRCNREGQNPVDSSLVKVFEVGSDWSTPPELEQYAQSARAILRQYGENALSLEAIRAYFQELYWQKGDQTLDTYNLLGLVEAGRQDNIPFELLDEKFRMIESAMVPVIIPFDGDARNALERLRYTERCGAIARQLQPYLVQIPDRALKELANVGAVQPVQPDRFGDQFMELVNMDLYDKRYGLSWSDSYYVNPKHAVI
ncbi:MAG: CRISPR-associated endonuclease Cas3'' [Cellvibrionaceae bacterium]